MPVFRVGMDIHIDNPVSLWSLASERLMADAGMTEDDLLDTLGPREDPDLASCLTLLLDPARWPGCTVQRLTCEAVRFDAPAQRDHDRQIGRYAAPPGSIRTGIAARAVG